MIALRPFFLSVPAFAGLALFAGCAHPGHTDAARRGPFFAPANHASEPSSGGIRRVVVLPAWVGEGTAPESAAALDDVLVTSLQQTGRFEVVAMSREECRRRFRTEALSSTAALPADLPGMIQREFAADAVLLIDITAFAAYKPLTLGLRAKLASVDGSRLIWSFDDVFSAAAPATANGARHFFLDRDRSVPADMTQVVLQSPSKFAEYAATTMFATLPPVTVPPARISR